jgi:hypothetical protein
MTDTPQNIKDLQLKIWLSKSPMERLKQFMEDNTSLFQFWAAVRTSDNSLSQNAAHRKDKQ